MSPPDITTTFGALLVGALFTSVLAGLSNLQTVLYYGSYRKDPMRVKILVFGVWLLDNAHTGLIWAGVWYYFIWNYGAPHKIDYIPWPMALVVLLTALITVLVHGFLIHRIFLLSNRNWYMTAPAIALTYSRLVCASITTFRMLDYQSFEMLQLRARWIFTLGLAVSSAVDVLIACLLVYLFRSSRTEAGGINHVLDKLILYGLESGSLTCVGTVMSMVCWVFVPQNLIFLGFYLVIGKLYSNSLFITLNTRKSILPRETKPVLFSERRSSLIKHPTELRIDVQTQVHYDARSIGARSA